ncbi:MAG: K(+)-transporting ATPase subunit F [Terriglobia bacterium]
MLSYFSPSAGLLPRPASGCRRESLFVIAGVAAFILFLYLLYALLHPERF